jgi:hypothetical protein
MSDPRNTDGEQRAEDLPDGAQTDTTPPDPGEDTSSGGGPEQPDS